MKTFKWFILVTLVAALFSCSENYNEPLEEEDSLDSQTRGELTQNDTTTRIIHHVSNVYTLYSLLSIM